MQDTKISLITNVSLEEILFDKYYAIALNRKGISRSKDHQCDDIHELKECLMNDYIKKLPLIIPLYQMAIPSRMKAEWIYSTLTAANWSNIIVWKDSKAFFINLLCLSINYSTTGTAGKVAKKGIKAYFNMASKTFVKTAELTFSTPKRLTAVYYAIGIFLINRFLLGESQEASEEEGLITFQKALVAIDKGILLSLAAFVS